MPQRSTIHSWKVGAHSPHPPPAPSPPLSSPLSSAPSGIGLGAEWVGQQPFLDLRIGIGAGGKAETEQTDPRAAHNEFTKQEVADHACTAWASQKRKDHHAWLVAVRASRLFHRAARGCVNVELFRPQRRVGERLGAHQSTIRPQSQRGSGDTCSLVNEKT